MRPLLKKILVKLLTLEARAVLRKYSPRIVAITGSVGKTSTKDAIYAVLSTRYHVRASQKSYNSEVGLPLTILGAQNAWNNPLRWLMVLVDGLFLIFMDVRYPEWLVLEVGADRPGDISSLKSWLKTDVAVVTRLPEVPVHVEFFESPEAVAEEKAALLDTVRPGGAVVLYGDDKRTLSLMHRLPAPDARVLTFGFNAKCDVQAQDVALIADSTGKPVGVSGRIVLPDNRAPVELAGTVGRHVFLPLVAAAAVGVELGMALEEILKGVERYKAPPGRMRVLAGVKNTVIVDDTYNSSPAAAVSALETLGEIKMRRKVAVLGDMTELGRRSIEEHRKVGVHAAGVCDLLVAVGFRARDIAQSALDAGLSDSAILQYEDSRKAGAELQNFLQEGDCVLVKGSQSMRMERVVEEIMAEPERAGELLVRQDAEWKKR